MADQLKKPVVTLGDVPLAAKTGISWKLRVGVMPFQTVMTVHKDDWDQKLKQKIGEALSLKIEDSQGTKLEFKEVYILHEVASDSPYRVNFVVSDKRWKWPYRIVVRDYNIPRKTGVKTLFNEELPIEVAVSVDEYTYQPNSLKFTPGDGDNEPDKTERWEAKEVVEDVLTAMDEKEEEGGSGGGGSSEKGWIIDSWPINDTTPNTTDDDGQFTITNLTLRDTHDQALARVISMIPGAVVYVGMDGKTHVADGADVEKTIQRAYNLPPLSYDGQKIALLDRKKLRPKKIKLYYQREIEMLLAYDDNLAGQTFSDPNPDEPYLENVIPTVDVETEVTEYDPVLKKKVTKKVPPGTYVEVKAYLAAMEKKRKELMDAAANDPNAARVNSFPWTFDTIKRFWMAGDLDGALGANGADLDEDGNFAMRVQTLKQHFRQTFRLNRRYMNRIRDMRAVRVGVLDPVSGARVPAACWGQMCIIPTTKGKMVAAREASEGGEEFGVWRNIDQVTRAENEETTVSNTPPGPARVSILDKDIGVFRIEWVLSPYGTIQSYVPCHVVGENNEGVPKCPRRDLFQQDSEPMGAGFKVGEFSNGLFLRSTLKLKVMLTVVPAAPNNRKQFQYRELTAEDCAPTFRSQFRIRNGEGPTQEVFVPPNELTARFGWKDDEGAKRNVKDLFGFGTVGELNDPDEAPAMTAEEWKAQDEPGIEQERLEEGFIFVNEDKEIADHAKSYAAQMFAAYGDNVTGTAVTQIEKDLKIEGNINDVSIEVAAAPSGKVRMIHNFPGMQRPINRYALLPEAARRLILGIPVYKE